MQCGEGSGERPLAINLRTQPHRKGVALINQQPGSQQDRDVLGDLGSLHFSPSHQCTLVSPLWGGRGHHGAGSLLWFY